MGTIVKCNIIVCKFQIGAGECSLPEIKIEGDEPLYPDMALCQMLKVIPCRKNKDSKLTMTDFIGKVPAEEKIDSVKEHNL